jgi:phosphoribosylformimino-5-aminoimidazole carboxamide ribotide isomerase
VPAEILERYIALGAAHVHVVDLDGARDGNQPNRELIVGLASNAGVRLQVGGGLRTLARVQDLLSIGVERAVIGSVAVTAADEVAQWMQIVGPERVVLAFDVRLNEKGTPMLTTHGWLQTSEVTLWQAVERYATAGLQHVLCTDVARDGAMTGPNCELYTEAVRRFPHLQWQASGGVASAGDLGALLECGVAAVISGKAMLENKISPTEMRPFLPNA